ncbi:hypothetical protein AAFX20_07740 [Vibrio chagasii]|uniref:hypothetical protein n=1 Tax=Vibrio chagasii TaxID=170679 RepID=UPI0038CD1FD2
MLIIAPELNSLCRYIRVLIVSALGGEPEDWHLDQELDEYITNIDARIVCLLHDLIVMLDYLYALKQKNVELEKEEREILEAAEELILAVKSVNERD